VLALSFEIAPVFVATFFPTGKAEKPVGPLLLESTDCGGWIDIFLREGIAWARD
jgi:hypothetical protein